jgi:hypothetical protein
VGESGGFWLVEGGQGSVTACALCAAMVLHNIEKGKGKWGGEGGQVDISALVGRAGGGKTVLTCDEGSCFPTPLLVGLPCGRRSASSLS